MIKAQSRHCRSYPWGQHALGSESADEGLHTPPQSAEPAQAPASNVQPTPQHPKAASAELPGICEPAPMRQSSVAVKAEPDDVALPAGLMMAQTAEPAATAADALISLLTSSDDEACCSDDPAQPASAAATELVDLSTESDSDSDGGVETG